MEPKTVAEIIVEWLKEHGYGGLVNLDAECGCWVDNFMPCCDCCSACVPAYCHTADECRACSVDDCLNKDEPIIGRGLCSIAPAKEGKE